MTRPPAWRALLIALVLPGILSGALSALAHGLDHHRSGAAQAAHHEHDAGRSIEAATGHDHPSMAAATRPVFDLQALPAAPAADAAALREDTAVPAPAGILPPGWRADTGPPPALRAPPLA